MYKNEMSKEEWAKAAHACDNQEWATSTPTCNRDCIPDHDCIPADRPFNIGDMVGMHQKFNDLNCSLGKLIADLQGVLFICGSREDVEKIKFSTPPATPVEICDASIAENLRHLETMIEDAKMLTNHISMQLGIEP